MACRSRRPRWSRSSPLPERSSGSIVWGIIADIYGRKASILLSAVMFVGTSICGAMPSLAWNIGMCFMMGAAAGGMLPVTYALLAEMMPSKHRGWTLVLVGGLGSVGGYFAASGSSALLQPILAGASCGCSTCRPACRWCCSARSSRNRRNSCSPADAGKRRRAVMQRFGSEARSDPPGRGGRLGQGADRRAHRQGLLRQAARPQPRGHLLRADQLRPAAVVAGRPGRQGLQHGADQQAARRNRR